MTGAVPISTAEVGDAVSAFPVPNRLVPVYHIFFASILSHQVEVNEELCIVIIKDPHNISDMVNL